MNQLEDKLKGKNLRLTNARKIIFEILKGSDRPLSPKDVCDELNNLSDLKADQASVYRNLMLFSKIGLAHRLQSGKYSVCQSEGRHDDSHVHIIMSCTECTGVYELSAKSKEASQLSKQMINSIKNFSHISSLTFNGVCDTCNN